MNGCDCAICATGVDQWCCRLCHDLAAPAPEREEADDV
jgi:hypothetical protein